MDKNFDFDTFTLEVVPFKYQGKKYELREASGKAAQVFNNAKVNRILFKDGKPQGMKDVGDLPIILLKTCCFDEKGRAVHEAIIAEWPDRIVSSLFEKAKEISGLEDDTDIGQDLRKAFKRPDAPISFTELQNWSEKLDDDTYEAVKDLFKPNEEEKAKNEQGSTTGGSE